jgi:peptidoglycan/xylan/chitin deacetylase (PgdA/CDA1 family)
MRRSRSALGSPVLPNSPFTTRSSARAIVNDRPDDRTRNGAGEPLASSDDSIIVAYHEICVEPSGYLYAVTARQLEDHLRVLSELIQNSPTKIPPTLITFDDGHISNYNYALPLLEKYSQRAIFFVTAGWTGVRDEVMSWSQLRELITLGHSVASHGWSHVPLTRCPLAEARQELERSKATLEDRLGIAADSISLPHGRWHDALLDLCAQVGYRRVYTSNAWMTSRQRDGVQLYGRLMMRRSTEAAEFRRLLTLGPSGRLFRRAQYGTKELARRMLGDRLYHRLWGLMAGRYDPDAMR